MTEKRRKFIKREKRWVYTRNPTETKDAFEPENKASSALLPLLHAVPKVVCIKEAVEF